MKLIGKTMVIFIAIFTICVVLVYNENVLADSTSHGGGGGSIDSTNSDDDYEKKKEEYEKKKETEYKANNSKLGEIGSGFDYSEVPGGSVDPKVKTPIKKLFSSILLVLQIASVGGVVFAGVRYMFASSEAKADIKNSMIHLVIGMAIVFASSTIINLVINIFNEVV